MPEAAFKQEASNPSEPPCTAILKLEKLERENVGYIVQIGSGWLEVETRHIVTCVVYDRFVSGIVDGGMPGDLNAWTLKCGDDGASPWLCPIEAPVAGAMLASIHLNPGR